MGIFILTMIITFSGSGTKPTSIVVEYNSRENCMTAAKMNRESLADGTVVLATCTKK